MSILLSLIKDIFTRKSSPDEMRIINNLNIALQEQGNLDDAINRYQKILALNPDDVDAHFNLGVAFAIQGQEDEALDCFRRASALDPKHYAAKIYLLHLMQMRCEWGGLRTDVQKLRKVVRDTPVTGENHLSPFVFLSLPGTTAEEQKCCAERFAQLEYPPQIIASYRHKLGFEFKHKSDKKIRLGYISSDFREHATAFLMAETFELHDRSRFHITAYSYGQDDGSAMRRRLEKAFDSFVDIRDNTHESAARRIYSDQTDILVDLKGYTTNSRSGILALRPAPVQVNYLGYPGTMGADFVDYLIADQFVIPPEHRKYYTEKVLWLPDCYQPNDRTRLRLAAPSRADCGLPENGFVFCCFNQTFKITPEIFEVWCKLLRAIPESSLWLLTSNLHAEGNLKLELENRGINSGRLVMATMLKAEKHLARLQCADLFLDTLPYNAHTTCSDALWMGLPVVTCAGETFPSRVAGSLLTAIGVPELITYSLEDYYRLALDLATDREKLNAIRSRIIANRDSSPLFDSERFTRNLEEAYSSMLREYSGKSGTLG